MDYSDTRQESLHVRHDSIDPADLIGAGDLEQAVAGQGLERAVDRAGLDRRPLLGAPAQELAAHLVAVDRLEQLDHAEHEQAGRGGHNSS